MVQLGSIILQKEGGVCCESNALVQKLGLCLWSLIFLSPRRVSPFLAWVDFHARSRFARSTIPEEKWGTTRSLRQRSPADHSAQRSKKRDIRQAVMSILRRTWAKYQQLLITHPWKTQTIGTGIVINEIPFLIFFFMMDLRRHHLTQII